MEKNKGNITIIQLVSWSIAITTTAVGIFWAKVSATDNRVDNVKEEQSITKERTAKLEEAVETIKKDNSEIKTDIKELLRRTK